MEPAIVLKGVHVRPVMSICIPTYNRSDVLDRSMESLTIQEALLRSGEVELVISDNASTDNTEWVVKKYVEKFPHAIRYVRNPVNLKDENFVTAMKQANGEFLKLANDSLIWKPGSLATILATIRSSLANRPILFFSNGRLATKEEVVHCSSFDQTIQVVSFWSTWIASFGIWRNDLDQIDNPLRSVNLKLIQTDLLLETLQKRGQAIVVNSELFTVQTLSSKGDYNILEVFGNNYLQLLQPYLSEGLLTTRTYEREKKKLFAEFLVPWVYNVSKGREYKFEISDWQKHSQYFKHNYYRYLLFPLAKLYLAKDKILGR